MTERLEIINCAICSKKLKFWNQPVFGKGDLKTGEKICSSCFMKINNKSPKTASKLKTKTLDEVKILLGLSHTEKENNYKQMTERTNLNAGSHLSEKLLRILKSKTNLNDKELDEITEAQGWGLIYSMRSPTERLLEICFTGFAPDEKDNLIKVALENNFHVAKSITKNLRFLCIGTDPGPSKMGKAKKQKVDIITKKDFLNLIETGEIPN